MWSMLLYFTLALLVLVIVHEYGHFLVARCCGVRVLRFSFGFGKVLASWHDRHNTEYTWSLVPLGGYVRMLDETEGDVPEAERHLAFNNKPVWARIAIVLAGPMFNFIFAFAALWLVLVIGIKSLVPGIDSVTPGSIAAQAGLKARQEIVAMNGKTVSGWRDVQYALILASGTSEPVAITVKSLADNKQETHDLSLASWTFDEKKQDVLDSIGLEPFIPAIPPVIGEVVPDSPAKTAGLNVGDRIISVDGHAIKKWQSLVDFVQLHPDQDVSLHTMRNGQSKAYSLHIGSMTIAGKSQGFLGVRSQDPAPVFAPWMRVQREAPVHAIGTALMQTLDLSGATFTLVGRLVTGKLSWHNISGPVGIAQGAGESASRGLPYYLFFLALVSVRLGVLNLLPIPMLDGGHLLFYFFEIILRRPVSKTVKLVGMYIGVSLLVMLMIVALHNDVTRLVG